jgi:hypothetical protein
MRRLELLAPPTLSVKERPRAAITDRFEKRLRAIAEALFASDVPADPKRIAWVAGDFCDFAASATGRARTIFVLGVWVLTWIAPLFVFRTGPLESLELDLRSRALEKIEASFLGFAALGPKAILCMIWFEHPDTRKETRTEMTCLM